MGNNQKTFPQGKTKDAVCVSRATCERAGTDEAGCSRCDSRNEGSAPFFTQELGIEQAFNNIKYPLFIMSGKGGVGKSSVTVNVAAALAQKGYQVGILDVDIHGPSIPNLLALGHGLEMDEQEKKLIPAQYLPNLHVVSMDSLLKNKNTAVLWRGPKKTTAIRQFLADVHWGKLDFLLIDSPPGTGDEHLTVLKLIPNVLCLIVTTPQEIALADVRKALNFLQHARAFILGVVENMSGLACPHCGKHIPVFASGGGKELAQQYNIPFLGEISLDPIAAEAADKGLPIVLMEEESIAKRDFLALAESVAVACMTGKVTRLALV
jgi:Mrp family chromosome partitioning ATPase